MEINQEEKLSARMRFRCFIYRNRYSLLAFALTFFAIMIVAIIRGIAPFGQNSLLTMDLWGQYYPMLVEKADEPFAMWSWNGSLGFSAIVQGAYYTNSLFNFLLIPFTGYARIAVLDLIVFLKLSLAAWSFAYYLQCRSASFTPLTTALGVAYGLSAYMIAFISQPMWLDAVAFFPLIMLGLERMLHGKNPWMYVTFLALTLYSNFYIGWAVCLFTVLWFFVTMCSDENRRGWKRIALDTGKFTLMSSIAGALAAFVLLPVVFGMQNWTSSSLGFDKEIGFYHKLPQIIDNLSVGVKPSLEYGVANLYCGSAAIFFAVLFILNRNIVWKKKLCYFLLAVFMVISFELNILDFIWHGLHFPNQLPGRQSFLYVFIILLMAYETLIRLDGLNFVGTSAAALISGGILFIGFSESKYQVGRMISVVLIALVFAVLMWYLILSRKYKLGQMGACMLAAIISLDAMGSGIYTMVRYLGCANAVSYVGNEKDMRILTQKYESGNDDFWRSEMTPNFTFDTGMLYDFKGITYYSSTMNGSLYTFFKRLGNRVYAQNVSTIYQPTPILDMMFGVRYHYVTGGALTEDYGDIVEKRGNITVIENRYTLPVAYAVDDDIAAFTTENKTPLEAQNDFIRLATGFGDRNAVACVAQDIIDIQNAHLYQVDGVQYYSSSNSSEDSVFEYCFEADRDGIFYCDFDFIVGNFTIRINDEPEITGSCGSNPLKNVGSVKKGDRIYVKVVINGYGIALYGVSGYIIDKDAIEHAHQKLSQNVLDVTEVSDTRIHGTIHLKEDAVMYSSIPAEMGWDVYVDGVKMETFALDGALLCFHIPEGEHVVEYRYKVPGLTAGIGMTAMGGFALAGYYLFRFFAKKRKRYGVSSNDSKQI